MEVREYISSGTLELYAMGVLTPSESSGVREMLSKHPEIKAELTKIELILEQYALAHGKEPKPELKNVILNKITELSLNDHSKKQAKEPISFSYMQIAAASAIFFLLLGNVFFFLKWQSSEKDVTSLVGQNYQLARGYDAFKARYQKTYKDLEITNNEAFKKIHLKGLSPAPQAEATLFFDEKSQETFIEVKNLPEPEDSKQYQLWALVDGKPVDAGIFEVSTSEIKLQKVKNIGRAQAFSVTLEQRGGSISPTLSQTYLMAKI